MKKERRKEKECTQMTHCALCIRSLFTQGKSCMQYSSDGVAYLFRRSFASQART